jgi:hypothetical protein
MKKTLLIAAMTSLSLNIFAQDCLESYQKKAKRRNIVNNSLILGGTAAATMATAGGAAMAMAGAGAIATGSAVTASAGAALKVYGLSAGAVGSMVGGISLINIKNQFNRVVDMLENDDSVEYLRFAKRLANKLKNCQQLSQLGAEELINHSKIIINDANANGSLCSENKLKLVKNYRQLQLLVKQELKERYQDDC